MKKIVCVLALASLLALAGCGGVVPTKSGTASTGSTGTAAASDTAKPLVLKIGETATYDTLKVTLVSAKKGPKDYSGKATLAVTVTYDNAAGTEAASFNEFDWKTEDADGARAQDTAILAGSAKSLGSGEVAPGGKKTGTIYFTGGKFTKIIYEPSFLASEENLSTWTLQ